MNKAEKRKIRLRILNIQDAHCKGCTKVPKYSETSKNHKTSWCTENCEIGRTLKKLGDCLDEGRTAEMGETKNWDQICTKAEKLREQAKEKWTWGKIANHFGVSDKTLYYHVAKRRDENQLPKKRVGTPKKKMNTKPLVPTKNVVEKKNEAIEITELAQEDILETLKAQITEFVQEKERLEKELLAETKLRLRAEEYTEFYQNQYREMEEDYSTLKNEFNAITEKGFEQRAEIKKLHDQLQISHTELEKERSHRLELQGKSQALGMALKAVL